MLYIDHNKLTRFIAEFENDSVVDTLQQHFNNGFCFNLVLNPSSTHLTYYSSSDAGKKLVCESPFKQDLLYKLASQMLLGKNLGDLVDK